MSGRFGYPSGRLPSMYEDTDTASLKAEREMFAEIADSRSPQEYIEILRRYNRLSDLAENPVTRQMRREKAELDAQEYYQRAAALGASRKEAERQQARKRRQAPSPAPHDEAADFIARELQKHAAAREWGYPAPSKPEAVPPSQQTTVQQVAPDVEAEWWPYDPSAAIGDGDREYQQRFKPKKGD